MAAISVFTIDVLMGMASAYGGAIGLAVTGTSVLKFVHKHQNDFPKWIRVFNRLLKKPHAAARQGTVVLSEARRVSNAGSL
jgi:hypothetical protein